MSLYNAGGGGANPFFGGELIPGYWQAEPGAAYSQWMGGLGGSNLFSEWLKRQYGTYEQRYKAASGYNPDLGWMEYLQGQSPQREYQGYSARDRGENPRNFSPNIRWVGF